MHFFCSVIPDPLNTVFRDPDALRLLLPMSSSPSDADPPKPPATCAPTDAPVKVIPPSKQTSDFVTTRDDVIKKVNMQYESVLSQYTDAYHAWMMSDPQNTGQPPSAVKQLSKQLEALRNEVDKDNKQVQRRIGASMDNMNGGTCSGDGDCNKDSRAACRSTAGCTWVPAKQQTLYETASHIAQQKQELADRQQSFASSQQRVTQMQSKYRYARKVFWIYVVVALLLTAGFVYLFMGAYKTFASGGVSLGTAITGTMATGVENMNRKLEDAKQKMMPDEKADVESDEMGDEGDEGDNDSDEI